MRAIWATIRIGLLDMRGDMQRFWLLIACLALGTALIAGVSSVGDSIKQSVERDAAEIIIDGVVHAPRQENAVHVQTLGAGTQLHRSQHQSACVTTAFGLIADPHMV